MEWKRTVSVRKHRATHFYLAATVVCFSAAASLNREGTREVTRVKARSYRSSTIARSTETARLFLVARWLIAKKPLVRRKVRNENRRRSLFFGGARRPTIRATSTTDLSQHRSAVRTADDRPMAGRDCGRLCDRTADVERTDESHSYSRLGRDFYRRRDQCIPNLDDKDVARHGPDATRGGGGTDAHVRVIDRSDRRPDRNPFPRLWFARDSVVLSRLARAHPGNNRGWAGSFYSRDLLAVFGLWCADGQSVALDRTCGLGRI